MTDARLIDPSAADPATATPCELRVLAGRAEGARASLERRRWIEVGYALSSDLVIRDPLAKGVRLRLRPREDAAELDLQEGEVSFLGHSLKAPASAILPAYVPLTIGASAVAFGEAESPRWSDAGRLLAAGEPETRSDASAEEAETEPADLPLPRWQLISPALERASRFRAALPIVGGAIVAVVLAATGWAGVSAWLNSAPSPERAQAALTRDGFPGLKVEASDTGLVARGLLLRANDLAALRQDISARNWPVALAVQTNDQLRQGVADVLRTNGYSAQVRSLGPGLLTADVSGGDPTKLESVRKEALRDNPGLKQLVFTGEGQGDQPASLVADDPNKRVIAVVGGDLGYVQTADGSRYFPGAILPSGHKIVAIADQDVTVELNGRTTHLKF